MPREGAVSEIKLACRSAQGFRHGRVHRVRVADGPVRPACRLQGSDRRYVITGEAVTCDECEGLS
jgi:hypothetical protein